MTDTTLATLTPLVFLVALLYSSVGHAGASGYLAAMSLLGVPPVVMRPTALMLNLIVAGIATARFTRAGWFSWRVFWPFAITSVPAAFLGGFTALPAEVYKRIVGVALLLAAVRLFVERKGDGPARTLPVIGALALGTAIGLLAGLTGVGGGIFLSPLLLFTRWADVKTTAGVSAAFILANSVAGMAGLIANRERTAEFLPAGSMGLLGMAVLLGGFFGSELGAGRLGVRVLRGMLGVVLVIAGAKMLLAV